MSSNRVYICAASLPQPGPLARPPAETVAAAVDGEGEPVFAHPPRRIVSLYPTASEILAALGAADSVAGITIHDRILRGLQRKPMVGGFARPDLERILALEPDCVLATPFHAEVVRMLRGRGVPVLLLDTLTLADGPANIRKLGDLLDRRREAEALVAREGSFLETVAAKTARIAENPEHRPLRVIRLTGFTDEALYVPGDDSFQNEFIRLAGGRAPVFGRKGPVIAVTAEEWRAFNAEAVYYCGHAPETVRTRLEDSAWAGIAALEADRLFSYPCDQICRAATRYGDFSLLLSSDLYGREYSEPGNQVFPDTVLARKGLDAPFSFVAGAEIVESRIFDVPAASLVIRFGEAQTVLSGLSGWASGITAVGIHYASPPSWAVTHHLGLEQTDARIMALLGLQRNERSFLYTGADMLNLAYAERASDGLRVGVFATAGVAHNAMRASVDPGRYVEPGTINLIILTNRQLTQGAMARAMITATEAKTAALEDLDIRSLYSGTAATGTGTDSILVVSGNGSPADLTGGHTKLGELMAVAVHAAVSEAVEKQNVLYPERDIFQRLAERGITPAVLSGKSGRLPGAMPWQTLAAVMETVLLEPRYAGFVAGALALSDGWERGLIRDTGAFSSLCLTVAGELAGKEISERIPVIADTRVPPLVREALDALATGILHR